MPTHTVARVCYFENYKIFFAINDVIASVVAVKFGKCSVTVKILPRATRVQGFVSFQ